MQFSDDNNNNNNISYKIESSTYQECKFLFGLHEILANEE